MKHFLTTALLYFKIRRALSQTAILSQWYFCVLGVDYYVHIRIISTPYKTQLFSISLRPNSHTEYWDTFSFGNLYEMLGYKFARQLYTGICAMLGILEIHEVKPEYLPVINSDNWLNTFDDGLYSQYLHCKDLSGAYFFINPTIINYSNDFIGDIDCSQAHNLASKNDFRPYMSIPQIWELSEHNIIGLHGFKHSKFTNFGTFKNDFELGVKFFEETLGLQVTAYCFPYNHTPSICKAYLESLGIEVFGESRIRVEDIWQS